MSDEIPAHLLGQANAIVKLAVAAAGQIGNDQLAWRKRVYGAIGDIGAMIREGSEAIDLAAKMAGASTFRATFVEWQPQGPADRPERLIVTTKSEQAVKNNPGKSDHNPEGLEEIRTEPRWTLAGRIMMDRVKQLQPGTPLLIYKSIESIDNGSKKVRVMPHFEIVGRPPQDGAPAQPRQQQPASQPPASEPQPPAVDQAPPVSQPPVEPNSPADNKALTEIEQRYEALPVKKRIAFAQLCRTNGITAFMVPEPADMERVLGYLSQVEAL